jgi:hypothetical protein
MFTTEGGNTVRAISPYSEYGVWLISPKEKVIMDASGIGHREVLEKGAFAQFQSGQLLDHEIEVALENFNFTGLPEGVSPLTRISSFDTEVYCLQYPESERDAMQAQLDNRLEQHAERFPGEIRVVPHPKPEIPWPSYDTMGVEEILGFQKALWVKPEKIRLYELDNANRSEIVEAMLDKEDPNRVKGDLVEASS